MCLLSSSYSECGWNAEPFWKVDGEWETEGPGCYQSFAHIPAGCSVQERHHALWKVHIPTSAHACN